MPCPARSPTRRRICIVVVTGFAVRSTSSSHISRVPEAGTRLIERQLRELGYIGRKRKNAEETEQVAGARLVSIGSESVLAVAAQPGIFITSWLVRIDEVQRCVNEGARRLSSLHFWRPCLPNSQHPHQYRDTRRELGAGAEDIASSYEVRLLTVGRFVSVETTEETFLWGYARVVLVIIINIYIT